jgi:6-pyruvoyltetrahydropterin/6-carboxytetrahydropterin synthase
MSRITCTRRIQFCAGHRVAGHENKCAHLHGHNYVALVTAEAEQLDSVGRVVDFSVLKERVGGWIDERWDHGMILWEDDGCVSGNVETIKRLGPCDAPQKLYLMPSNPTAENMAAHLGAVICPQLLADVGVRVVEIVLWETENCYATWRAT